MDGRGKSSEGAAFDSAWASSVVACLCSDSADSTSTGDSDSSRVRSATRVPVTTTSSVVSSCGPASCEKAGSASVPSAAATARRRVVDEVVGDVFIGFPCIEKSKRNDITRRARCANPGRFALVFVYIGSDVIASREFGDVLTGAKGQCLDGHGRLAAPGRDQAAAVTQEEIADVVRAVMLVD